MYIKIEGKGEVWPLREVLGSAIALLLLSFASCDVLVVCA